MTFNPTEFYLWYKEYSMFSLWALNKNILFIPKEFSEDDDDLQKWDLASKVYILMKRLGQDYDKIMLMDADERDTFFEMEMKLIREEQKQRENNDTRK